MLHMVSWNTASLAAASVGEAITARPDTRNVSEVSERVQHRLRNQDKARGLRRGGPGTSRHCRPRIVLSASRSKPVLREPSARDASYITSNEHIIEIRLCNDRRTGAQGCRQPESPALRGIAAGAVAPAVPETRQGPSASDPPEPRCTRLRVSFAAALQTRNSTSRPSQCMRAAPVERSRTARHRSRARLDHADARRLQSAVATQFITEDLDSLEPGPDDDDELCPCARQPASQPASDRHAPHHQRSSAASRAGRLLDADGVRQPANRDDGRRTRPVDRRTS